MAVRTRSPERFPETSMTSDLQSSYDAFPYESFPFPQTHPDRLATLGWIFGLNPTPIERARVLEIGCAAGGNLVPLAALLPESEFIGVDFSQVQVHAGRDDVEALGLSNIRLLNMDITAFDATFGNFDYIIAHGVYSWVRNPVQEKILELCARRLTPQGIAYISYNTLPGWGMRGVVRAAMRYHTRQFPDPEIRVQQARAMLGFLAESAAGDSSAYGVMLRSEAEEVSRKPDYYLLHDHLEEVNEPLYFHQFMERATQHRLRYLGEAHFPNMFVHDLAPQVAQTLVRIAPDLMKREQFMDFLRNRTFRQTLLVRENAALERKIAPLRVAPLHVASRARPVREKIDVRTDGPEEFRVPDGSGLTAPRRIVKAALTILAEYWPAALPFERLCEMAAAYADLPGASEEERNYLASTVLNSYAAGVVELHFAPSHFVLACGPTPEAGALPRLQAARGSRVTNLRHEPVNVDELTRQLLPLLDGTKTRQGIASLAWPALPHSEGQRLLDEALPQFARQALMVR